jgi:hypothetical protein
MDISSIGNNYGITTLDPTQVATAQAAAAGSTSASDSTQMSPMASLLNQLQQLQQSDPDKFKSVMASIADTLTADAQNATGPQAQRLTNLANKFNQAAQTGQMPDLQPAGQQKGASAHHHHHHHVQSYNSTSGGAGGSGSTATQPQVDLAQIIQAALQQSSE